MSVNKILDTCTYIAYTYFTPYIYLVLHHKFAIYWDKSYDPTVGNESVETLGSKIRFSSFLEHFSPPPSQTMLVFDFLGSTDYSAYTTLNWGPGVSENLR